MAASAPLARVALLLLLLHAAHHAAHGGAVARLAGTGGARMASPEGYAPVQTAVYRPAASEAFEPFQLCMGCRCCPAGNNGSSCVDTQCCYGINCNLPGKPFGTCAFTPRTCGCGANNCTAAPAPPSS
ncbi:hypothetical protein CFC21_034658 [Triticum aestivum]|uniref:DUF7866 domain-containing protein n=2 Tax=Triticum aestivum TaxID=4565 RepID=A0A3B6KDJ2_WHEAT|nr:uncharacterized protein LOC123106859 [Triticum aestivum]KAF7021764.1 hypothetical protein CFC21_034658 [Triticum aestivum]